MVGGQGVGGAVACPLPHVARLVEGDHGADVALDDRGPFGGQLVDEGGGLGGVAEFGVALEGVPIFELSTVEDDDAPIAQQGPEGEEPRQGRLSLLCLAVQSQMGMDFHIPDRDLAALRVYACLVSRW